MARPEEDLLFHRFRRHGDVEALGGVFDRVAPKLLLVAAHLSGDAAAAEDLVQTVFLQAIRDRGHWDGKRRLLPWLLGILEHRARDRARAVRRRGEEPMGTEPASGPDPAAEAERREALSRVAAALDALPADYRDVLTLRLVHSLRAVDIAHARGLPPATVRTRLRRGLEQLRRSLPRGLVAPAVLALLAAEAKALGRGLHAARAEVVRAGAAVAGVAAGSTFALKSVLAVAGLTATLLGAWALWPRAPESSVDMERQQPPLAADLRGVADAGKAHRGSPGHRRTEVADDRTTVLEGRVVDSATGRPLAGCTVALRSTPDSLRYPRLDEWQDRDVVETRADGRFRVEFVPPVDRPFALRVEREGRIPVRNSWSSLRQGLHLDFGDVILRDSVALRIRVADVEGRPIAGLRPLYLRSEREARRLESSPPRPRLHETYGATHRATDESGVATWEMLPPRTFVVCPGTEAEPASCRISVHLLACCT